jgi:hypothetical protein
MSETTTGTTILPMQPATSAALPPLGPRWDGVAKMILGVISQVLMIGVLIYAYISGKDNIATIVTGAIVVNATTVINYYMGNSSGSDRKTELLAAAPAPVASPNTTHS